MNDAQAVGEPRPDDREHAERERRVGRHRRAPAVRGRAARGEREIDGDRHDHAAEAREQRQRHAAALAQLADVELAPRLEADDEEEERHQAGVDPLAQVEGDARAAEPDREGRVPEAVVAREIDVRPEERRDARCEQERRASGLRREELAHRRSEVACPGRVPGEGAGFGVLIRHRMILAAGAESGEAQCPAGSSTTTGMRRARLLRVLVVARIRVGERAPEPLALLALGVACVHVAGLAAHGHFRVRARLEVQVPERVLRRAALRRDHCIAVAGVRVEERVRSRLAALAPGRRQEEHGHLADAPGDLAAARPVDGVVDRCSRSGSQGSPSLNQPARRGSPQQVSGQSAPSTRRRTPPERSNGYAPPASSAGTSGCDARGCESRLGELRVASRGIGGDLDHKGWLQGYSATYRGAEKRDLLRRVTVAERLHMPSARRGDCSGSTPKPLTPAEPRRPGRPRRLLDADVHQLAAHRGPYIRAWSRAYRGDDGLVVHRSPHAGVLVRARDRARAAGDNGARDRLPGRRGQPLRNLGTPSTTTTGRRSTWLQTPRSRHQDSATSTSAKGVTSSRSASSSSCSASSASSSRSRASAWRREAELGSLANAGDVSSAIRTARREPLPHRRSAPTTCASTKLRALAGAWTVGRESVVLEEAGGSSSYRFDARRRCNSMLSAEARQPIPFRRAARRRVTTGAIATAWTSTWTGTGCSRTAASTRSCAPDGSDPRAHARDHIPPAGRRGVRIEFG